MKEWQKWLEKAGLLKQNYRKELIPVGAGIIFILVAIIFWYFYRIQYPEQGFLIDRLIYLVIIVGGAGFIDDIQGGNDTKGFKGHFHSFVRGQLTTGALKALLTLVGVLLVVDKSQTLWVMILDIALILLMTNFFNLLDLRPGRVIKVFIILSLIIGYFLGEFWPLFLPIYIVIVPYLLYELQGQVMLGDTGANVLGAIIGFTFSYWTFIPGKFIITFILIILTLLSEKYSFTEYIAQNKILNWFDQLGRSQY